MKNYFNISIIILFLSSPVTANIVLPEISQDIQNLANDTVNSNARIKAFNIQKPVISQALKKQVNNLIKQTNQHIEEHQSRVKKLVDKTINNKAWKFKQTQLIKEMNKEFGIEDENNKSKDVSGHRLYLFVSSSIPKNKMRQYARQLVKYPNTQMLMRGFIGGGKKMQPTLQYIKSVVVKNKDCIGVACKIFKTKINIDPVLFQRYKVTKVPTLVYVDELSGGSYCSEGNAEVVNANGVHKFIGLAPLNYMLSELADKSKIKKLKEFSEL